MEQGNEGDEIILLALRQIEWFVNPVLHVSALSSSFDFPPFSGCLDEIKSISQLGPEAIVEIVARSLWLISQGEVKVCPKRSDSLHI
jgi:hypothetical protein